MRERPILFSAPMVKAILEDRKTQTRRALNDRDLAWFNAAAALGECGRFLEGQPITPGDRKYHSMLCRYGEPGDRLWVRESFATLAPGSYEEEPPREASGQEVRYAANREDAALAKCNDQRWRPSIHMPRWASRILLEIESIRVERLQEISQEDAISEGSLSIRSDEWDRMFFPRWKAEFEAARSAGMKPPLGPSPRETFQALWNSINASWDDNPWVWVVSFRRIEASA